MANTSSTGGYLVEVSAPVAEDDALDSIFQKLIVGVTGLPGNMVRPRWQPTTPKMPDPTENWCAIGVIDDTPDDTAVIVHDGYANGGLGQDNLQRHEEITVMASFYGPNAKGNAKKAREGIYVPQNREELYSNGIAFINTGQIIAAPEFIDQQWLRRYDMQIHFRRVINRAYAIENIAEADIQVNGVEINVTQ